MDGFISDETIRQTQTELNTLYDGFTAKYGLINSRANALAFAEDSSYYLLCSLEELDEDKNLKRKADMFTRRTIRAHEAVTSAVSYTHLHRFQYAAADKGACAGAHGTGCKRVYASHR